MPRRPARACRLALDRLEDRLTPAQFTVTTTADAGAGSLRQAIMDSNANPGPDLIRFNIPGDGVHVITLSKDLPFIRDAVTIDGYSQPGASPNTLAVGNNARIRIEIDAAGKIGIATT